jgi:hypothetical protein
VSLPTTSTSTAADEHVVVADSRLVRARPAVLRIELWPLGLAQLVAPHRFLREHQLGFIAFTVEQILAQQPEVAAMWHIDLEEVVANFLDCANSFAIEGIDRHSG